MRWQHPISFAALAGALAVTTSGLSGCDSDDTETPTPTGSGTGATGGSGATGGGGTAGTAGTAGTGGEAPCTPDDVQDCYEGPAGTEDVGNCHGGTQTCGANGTWGNCGNQQLPETEDCNVTGDEDCDGVPCSDWIWSEMWGNTGVSVGMGVAADAAGNMVITGFYVGSGINLGGSVLPSSFGNEIFVAKYDATGAHLWSKGIAGPGNDAGTTVAIDGNGDVILGGMCQGNVDFGGTAGTADCDPTMGLADVDMFMAKLDGSNGDSIWVRTYANNGGSLLRWPTGIAIDSQGTIIVGGFHTGVFIPCMTHTPTDSDGFVFKVNASDGTRGWTHCFHQDGTNNVHAIAVDSSDNLIVGGNFSTSVPLGSTTLTSHGGVYAFLAKFNSSGTPQWGRHFGDGSSSTSQTIYALDVDASDAIVVGGMFARVLEADSGATATTNQPSDTNTDIFVAKYGANNAYDWHTHVPDVTGDLLQRVTALEVDSQGDVAIGGGFLGTIDLGNGNIAADGADIFVGKLAGADGSFLWSKHFGAAGGTQDSESVFCLDINGSDQIVMTGGAWGAIDFGSGTAHSHSGQSDIFAALFQP